MEVKKTIEVKLSSKVVEEMISSQISEFMEANGYALTNSDRNEGFPDIVYYGEEK